MKLVHSFLIVTFRVPFLFVYGPCSLLALLNDGIGKELSFPLYAVNITQHRTMVVMFTLSAAACIICVCVCAPVLVLFTRLRNWFKKLFLEHCQAYQNTHTHTIYCIDTVLSSCKFY